ncbi:MAG: hypothetical protein RL204_2153 [Bacteroidota bacterium]|jgi:hypothetical protein
MNTGSNIRVDNPCPFLLSRMKKEGDNYFCGSCSKTVVDFREKSTEEIIRQSKPGTCGVFRTEQLTGQRKQNLFRKSLFFLLTVMSFLGFNVKPLSAQTNDSTRAKTERVIIDRSNNKGSKESKIKVERPKKRKKKGLFRRRKQTENITIGCPSF